MVAHKYSNHGLICLNPKYTKIYLFYAIVRHKVWNRRAISRKSMHVYQTIKIYQNTKGHDFCEIKENISVLMTNFLLPDDQITRWIPRRIQPIISQILSGIDTQTII